MIYGEGSGPTRVGRKRRERRRYILDVALHVCARHGIEGMTVQRLAEHVDLTPGALYRYFPSKEAIIAELEARAIADIAAHLQAARAEWDGVAELAAADERIQALFRLIAAAHFYVGLLDELPEQLRLLGMMLGDPRTLVSGDDLARVVPGVVALIGDVARLFGDAISVGALGAGDVRERTIVMWATLQGIVQLDKLTRFDAALFEPRGRGSEAARALLAGWGAGVDELGDAMALFERWRKQCSQRLQ